MSQDTAEELNGRFTAIQGHTFSLMNTTINIKDIIERSQLISAQQLVHLSNIDTSTQVLPAMMGEMRTMRVAIETITERGVKML
ncbi:hypothetical protein FQZ97_1063790 [compost metagenome]